MSSTPVQPSSDQLDVIDLDDTASNKPKDDQAKLEHLHHDWTSPIYAFYEPIPQIRSTGEGNLERKFHDFICAKKGCGKHIQHYLDKGDAKSTSNLKRHAMHCWKEHVVQSVLNGNDLKEACKVVTEHHDGVLTSHFEHIGKGKVMYSSIQPTKAETRAEVVCWVSESNWPFKIVANCGFLALMKTGRPHMYVPRAMTIASDVHLFFA
ncbi:hypothetical protein AX15_007962 [Amanita polypyramis BW_CC]|nr:hypothetical protein AX15_007962 [Amanita polypyramis BW_CC]